MPVTIKNEKIENAEKIVLDKVLWGFNDYQPMVYAKVVYNEKGFDVEFTIEEKDPLRKRKEHFDDICKDSCVEFFANFDPEHSDRYINFEINANGAMYVSLRKNREIFERFTVDEIEELERKVIIEEDFWKVSYHISYDLLKRKYPHFDIKNLKYILGNMHKCGSDMEFKHYLTLFEIKWEKPDFHRPESFGRIELA